MAIAAVVLLFASGPIVTDHHASAAIYHYGHYGHYGHYHGHYYGHYGHYHGHYYGHYRHYHGHYGY
jgi:hypothetical protein